MRKRAQTTPIIITLIGICVIVFLLLIMFNPITSPTGQAIKENNCRDVQVSYEAEEEYLKSEYYTETVPYVSEECEKKDLAYSQGEIRTLSTTCNEYQDVCNKYILGICADKTTFCVDKTITCSLNVKNLDNEEKGYWMFELDFDGFTREGGLFVKKVGTQKVTRLIYPQSEETFRTFLNVVSSGVDGDANLRIFCGSYSSSTIPTKTICEDITRYKEMQREKQVTAYRPITKYKTEEKCD